MVVGSAAILVLGIAPILLGSLAQAGRLSQAGVGQAAMVETFGLALGATFGPFWMAKGAMRTKALIFASLLAALNLATVYATSTGTVLIERAAAGVVAGLLLGAANVVIVNSKSPDRLAGILLGLSMVPQIAAAYLLPVMLIPRYGPAAGFYLIVAGALLAAASTPALIDRVRARDPGSPAARTALSPGLLFFAGAILVQNCGVGASWNYVERLSHQHGFAADVIGMAVALSLGCQVAAAWLSAWLSPRLAKWPMLLSLVALQTVFVGLALVDHSPGLFIVAVCVFGSTPPAMQPFLIAEMIALDPTRRAAMLVGPLILFGNGLGPLMASFLVREADVRPGYWLGVSLIAASAGLYLAAAAASRLRLSASRSRLA
jgi:predicted MFS family arabinose efflux permease